MRNLLIIIPLFIISFGYGQTKTKTEKVILITLDGMRWQEIFGGAEDRLLHLKKFVSDTTELTKMYGGSTAEEKRHKLMPFFWDVIATKGQLYGNRKLGSKVNTTNKMWFSYPGYNEILTGSADDVHVTSNDPVDNPNKNVLEFINAQPSFKGKVVAFGSWENFPWIINTTRSGVPVNAGLMKVEKNPTENDKLLNDLMFQLPDLPGKTRLDGLTFHYALEDLKTNKPKVLYLSFDETDHFAHEGNYDQYLNSAHYIDGFVRTLWEWTQSQSEYNDKTTIVLTTDHGRGNKDDEDWRHHGSKTAESDQIWLAVIGPDTAPLGESKSSTQLYQNQIASTITALLGLNYTNDKKPGDAIVQVIKK